MALPNPKLGLRARYTLYSVVLVILMVSVISVAQLHNFNQTADNLLHGSTTQTKTSLLNQAKKRGDYIVAYLAESLINPVYQFDMEATRRLLLPALSHEEVVSVIVFNEHGDIFHDGSETVPTFGQQLASISVLGTVLGHKESFLSFNEHYLELAQPLFISDRLLGGVYIKLSLEPIMMDIRGITKEITNESLLGMEKTKYTLFIIAIMSILAGIGLSYSISHTMVSPIRDLVSYTKRIVQGDYAIHTHTKREDELGELVNAFNDMGKSLAQHTKEISFLAYHDALTKLPNRIKFTRNLTELIEGADNNSRFTVLFIDLDEFKFINDNYGHKSGDILLCQVSERINLSLRPGDIVIKGNTQEASNFTARIGGDEFLICLPHIDNEQTIQKIAQRLIRVIKEPICIQGDSVSVAASIGIATYPDDGLNADDLIKNADIAMYHAKDKGKNTYAHFNQELDQQVKNRLTLEIDMRKALDNDGEFELHYQPQVSLANSKNTIGAEALIRWDHPIRGMIPPDEFIPVAEASGLIIPLGEKIIEAACQQIAHWRDITPSTFHVAINLSAKQIYRSNCAETIASAIDKYQIRPGELHVEVTESLLMKDEVVAKAVIKAIHALGVPVWLDDFGTGYSSLSYLRMFSFDGVKIDRSFIDELDSNSFDQALTSSVINMTKSLGIAVVAEGVETAQQELFLAGKQCDIAQGYLYSKPVCREQFEQQFIEAGAGCKVYG